MYFSGGKIIILHSKYSFDGSEETGLPICQTAIRRGLSENPRLQDQMDYLSRDCLTDETDEF